MSALALHLHFNSRPHEEVDLLLRPIAKAHHHFNSRPHEEVDKTGPIVPHNNNHFNSRPHKEVDEEQCKHNSERSEFQLTISQGGRLSCSQVCTLPNMYFNSRPHKEVDTCYTIKICTNQHFNSRPHKEVDTATSFRLDISCISTHDLTRRSTEERVNHYKFQKISTHDLTRRSTTPR